MGEDRVYFSLQSIMKGSQGRNMEAGGDAEATEEQHLLACLPQLAQPAFVYNPGMAPFTAVWAPPYKSLLKKMAHRVDYRPI